MERMVLVGLRTEVGLKKTDQCAVSFVAGTWRIHHTRLLVYDTMSVIVEAFTLPSNATRFELYKFNR